MGDAGCGSLAARSQATVGGGVRRSPQLLADDNRVPADVDSKLTGLLEKVVARSAIHHAMFTIATSDGERSWSGAAGPARPDGGPLQPDTGAGGRLWSR